VRILPSHVRSASSPTTSEGGEGKENAAQLPSSPSSEKREGGSRHALPRHIPDRVDHPVERGGEKKGTDAEVSVLRTRTGSGTTARVGREKNGVDQQVTHPLSSSEDPRGRKRDNNPMIIDLEYQAYMSKDRVGGVLQFSKDEGGGGRVLSPLPVTDYVLERGDREAPGLAACCGSRRQYQLTPGKGAPASFVGRAGVLLPYSSPSTEKAFPHIPYPSRVERVVEYLLSGRKKKTVLLFFCFLVAIPVISHRKEERVNASPHDHGGEEGKGGGKKERRPQAGPRAPSRGGKEEGGSH